jgi:hypothetical protein
MRRTKTVRCRFASFAMTRCPVRPQAQAERVDAMTMKDVKASTKQKRRIGVGC